MVPILVPVFLVLIYGLPLALAAIPAVLAPEPWLRVAAVAAAPVIFAAAFVAVAGTLSLPFQRAIVRGKFPRDLKHPVYGPRRLYGLCWTAVFYFSPLYYAILAVPSLKTATLRLFGYRGPTDFTVYPDTWVRDLPILHVGSGAYLSNKSTIGTNICLKNGAILVDDITAEQGAMVGHLAMIAPGAWLGRDAEIGVGSAIGIRARIGERAKIGGCCAINHGAEIGAGVDVATHCYVGIKAVVRDGVKLPGGANIPAGAVIGSQEDVQRYLSSETELLRQLQEKMVGVYASGAPGAGGLDAAEALRPEALKKDAA
jgi:carbonic anhydrase/acetyltransferase-like protein (isoleucine patch superfamily)